MKKFLRSVFSLCLCGLFVLGLSTLAYASAGEFVSSQVMEINEFDVYNAVKNASEVELLEYGYSSKEIEKLKNVDIEHMIYQRAELSDSVLEHMGYTYDEIHLLRNYDGEYADTRALTGTLSAEIVCEAATSSGYNLHYKWSWDHAPIVVATDSVGMRWAAVAQDLEIVDVTASFSYVSITYNDDTPYTKVYNASDSNFADSADFNAITCSFPMSIPLGYDNPCYALSGEMATLISRDLNGTRSIYYLKVCGVYGHSIISIGAPTVSFTPGDLNIGISFTGGLNTENLGIKKYKIYSDGRKVPIDA